MKKFIQNIVTIITIAAGIVAILSYVYQIKSNKPILEVLEISNDNLTNLPKVNNLSSSFYYKDSLITNLWKLNATIKNIGDQTLIGKGTNKNIIGDNLTFTINKGFKLIDFNISLNESPYEIDRTENKVLFKFMQWRKDEKIDIVVYAEQLTENSEELKLILNEREIIDGEINYRKINQEIKSKRLIDHLPKSITNILFWFAIVFNGFLFLLIPFGIISETNKYFKLNKWKNNWKDKFDEKVAELFLKREIPELYKYNNAPKNLFDKLNIPVPEKLDTPIWGLIIASIFVFMLLGAPILWMIEI